MTIHECMMKLSAKGTNYVRKYYARIQPFEVEPSATYEFNGEFSEMNGEKTRSEITLDEDLQIEDMFCTCGADGLCIHLATMMYDIEERDTLFISEFLQNSELKN